MKNTQEVFYGMAGQFKSKLKNPTLVYENKEDAKEYANNYTDLSKEPKVIKFDVDCSKIIDLTTEQGKENFQKVLKAEGLKVNEVINYEKQYFDDVEPQIENLDTLVLKKVIKSLSNEFDMIKGFTMLDENQTTSFLVLNNEVLKYRETLEIDLEGDLWKVEFKK